MNRQDGLFLKQPLKTALVTGGAKRIGKAIVEDLAARGFSLAIHANSSIAEAEALARALRERGLRAAALCCDLSDDAATARLIDAAVDAVGPLGLLVNNASLFKPDTVETFDAVLLDRHMAVHVKAPSVLTRDFVRQLPPGAAGSVARVCARVENGEESGMRDEVWARIRRAGAPNSVMAGRGPAIHELSNPPYGCEVVDAKAAPWHDAGEGLPRGKNREGAA